MLMTPVSSTYSSSLFSLDDNPIIINGVKNLKWVHQHQVNFDTCLKKCFEYLILYSVRTETEFSEWKGQIMKECTFSTQASFKLWTEAKSIISEMILGRKLDSVWWYHRMKRAQAFESKSERERLHHVHWEEGRWKQDEEEWPKRSDGLYKSSTSILSIQSFLLLADSVTKENRENIPHQTGSSFFFPMEWERHAWKKRQSLWCRENRVSGKT